MSTSTPILQQALTDLLDLGLVTKQAHWNVYGPSFRAVHLQLDDVYEQVIEWQDEVAERIAALGDSPDGRAASVVAGSTIAPMEAGPVAADAVVKGFAERLTALSAALSANFAALDDDLASQDILIGIVAGLDKQAWFFRAAA
jgi:starvation-inducible DNA-binding protein